MYVSSLLVQKCKLATFLRGSCLSVIDTLFVTIAGLGSSIRSQFLTVLPYLDKGVGGYHMGQQCQKMLNARASVYEFCFVA